MVTSAGTAHAALCRPSASITALRKTSSPRFTSLSSAARTAASSPSAASARTSDGRTNSDSSFSDLARSFGARDASGLVSSQP